MFNYVINIILLLVAITLFVYVSINSFKQVINAFKEERAKIKSRKD